MKEQVTRKVMSSLALAVLAAVAAGALLAACGGTSEPGASGTPKTVEATPAVQPGTTVKTTVEANVGDTVVVSLAANATTGYSWELTAGDTFTIESSKYVPSPAPSNMAGVGGTQVVTLKVTKAGQSDLTGMYRQPWLTPSPDAQPDLVLTVVSK
jgi:predicted secreted protein